MTLLDCTFKKDKKGKIILQQWVYVMNGAEVTIGEVMGLCCCMLYVKEEREVWEILSNLWVPLWNVDVLLRALVYYDVAGLLIW